MDRNFILLSYWTYNTWSIRSHVPLLRFFKMVFWIMVLWQERWIPGFSCLRPLCVWHVLMIASFVCVWNLRLINYWIIKRWMVSVIIGNSQREINILSYWVLMSIHWMTADFSFLKLYLFAKCWKLQGCIIVMVFQHSPGLSHLLVHIRMVLRIIDTGPTHTLLPQVWCYILHKTQDKIFPFLFISVHSLHIITRHYIRLKWIGYGGIYNVKRGFLLFNPSKIIVVDCYVDEDFAISWGHENTQDPICAKSRTGFVVIFSNWSYNYT